MEGIIINTGRHFSYKIVTLKIESSRDGGATSVTYTVPEEVVPGKQASFRFKPGRSPEKIKVTVASAYAD